MTIEVYGRKMFIFSWLSLGAVRYGKQSPGRGFLCCNSADSNSHQKLGFCLLLQIPGTQVSASQTLNLHALQMPMIKIQNTSKYHISQESVIVLKYKKQINHVHMCLRAVIIATLMFMSTLKEEQIAYLMVCDKASPTVNYCRTC